MYKEVNFHAFPYEASANLRISSVLYSACRDSIKDGAEFKASCYGIRLLSDDNMEMSVTCRSERKFFVRLQTRKLMLYVS